MTNSIIEQASQSITGMQYGTLITHESMGAMVYEKPGTTKYYSIVNKLRKYLMETYSVFLRTFQKKGYEISKPEEQVKVCEHVCVRGVKLIGKGVNNMTHIDMNKIPDDKRKETIGICNKYGSINGMLKMGMKQKALEENKAV